MNCIIKTVRSLSKIGSWIAACALLTMLLLTSLDVFLRYIGKPIFGSFEIIQFLLALVIGFSLAYTEQSKGHIAIEFFVERLSPTAQNIIAGLMQILTLGILGVIIWQCGRLGWKMMTVNQLSMTLRLPLYPFLFMIAFAFFLMSLEILLGLGNIYERTFKK